MLNTLYSSALLLTWLGFGVLFALNTSIPLKILWATCSFVAIFLKSRHTRQSNSSVDNEAENPPPVQGSTLSKRKESCILLAFACGCTLLFWIGAEYVSFAFYSCVFWTACAGNIAAIWTTKES
jgi:hypothetical protein